MVCEQISSIKTIADLLVWSTGCYYYFWLVILSVIFIIIGWKMYKAEEKRKGEGDMISALGVSSISTTFLAVIGTLIKNNQNIPMIQPKILSIFLAFTIVIVLIWIFKDK